jgi:hypothetical protein
VAKTAWPGKVSREELHAEWARQQKERQEVEAAGRAKIRAKLELLDLEIYHLQRLEWQESQAALARLGINPDRLPPPLRVHESEYRRAPRATVHTTQPASEGKGVLYRPSSGTILEIR